jgi:tyrosyl-tRNA synthetase
VDEPPYDMYGKVMSIPDHLIMLYFELLTDVPDEDLNDIKRQLEKASVNPMLLKKRLATEIVAQFHGSEQAKQADERFAREVQSRESPEFIPEFQPVKAVKGTFDPHSHSVLVSGSGLLVEAGLVDSSSAARRLIDQGAVDIDGKTVTAADWTLTSGSIIRVGKRKFRRIVLP